MKQLHTNTKIFFPNPHVIRLDHEDDNGLTGNVPASFKKLLKDARNTFSTTWGFCYPEHEMVKVKNDFGQQHPPGSVQHNHGVPLHVQVASLFNPDWNFVARSYWCFKDELDALQFRLMAGKTLKMRMWPSRMFTIYEITEDES
jgi:hypothetical protein